MTVKLRCIDNGNYDYFTKGKEYEGFSSSFSSKCYYIKNDEFDQCVVSLTKDFHGKWEVVN